MSLNTNRLRKPLPALLLALTLLLIGACTRADQTAVPPTDVGDPGEMIVEEIDILILESFPVQIHVIARGKLPDACSFVDKVVQTRQDDKFLITLTPAWRENARCAAGPTPFEQIIPLDVLGLKAGVYTVTVDGVTGTFELAVDNVLDSALADPGNLAFTWHREGGIAGFCDNLAVYTSGQVGATPCSGEFRGEGQLTAEQLAQLQAWLGGLHGFAWEQTDDATADAMTVRLFFYGTGPDEAAAANQQTLRDLAADLFAGVGSPPE